MHSVRCLSLVNNNNNTIKFNILSLYTSGQIKWNNSGVSLRSIIQREIIKIRYGIIQYMWHYFTAIGFNITGYLIDKYLLIIIYGKKKSPIYLCSINSSRRIYIWVFDESYFRHLTDRLLQRLLRSIDKWDDLVTIC